MHTTNWHILVVEDEFDSLQMVSKILSYHGITVEVAHNGHECLDRLTQFEPTLIITDLAMPGMDGWELLHAVRSDPHTQHIPVVAMTAYDSVGVVDAAQQAGFDGYLPKPVDPRSLVQHLAAIIQT
jgi:CheY-like chemotaxis protein